MRAASLTLSLEVAKRLCHRKVIFSTSGLSEWSMRCSHQACRLVVLPVSSAVWRSRADSRSNWGSSGCGTHNLSRVASGPALWARLISRAEAPYWARRNRCAASAGDQPAGPKSCGASGPAETVGIISTSPPSAPRCPRGETASPVGPSPPCAGRFPAPALLPWPAVRCGRS